MRVGPSARRSGLIWPPPREVTPAVFGESISPKLGICCSTSPIVAGARSSIACEPSTVSGVGARTPAGRREPVTMICCGGLSAGADCAAAETEQRSSADAQTPHRGRAKKVGVHDKLSGARGTIKSPPEGGPLGWRDKSLALTPSPRACARLCRTPAPLTLLESRGFKGCSGRHERHAHELTADAMRRQAVKLRSGPTAAAAESSAYSP